MIHMFPISRTNAAFFISASAASMAAAAQGFHLIKQRRGGAPDQRRLESLGGMRHDCLLQVITARGGEVRHSHTPRPTPVNTTANLKGHGVLVFEEMKGRYFFSEENRKLGHCSHSHTVKTQIVQSLNIDICP